MDAYAGLPALTPLPTAAQRAAGVIRDGIFEGRFRPGAPLTEAALAKALNISRNTVREAFRSLMAEHLLEYTAHKGVSVRRPSKEDIADIYQVRRTLELAAVDRVRAGDATVDGAALQAAVTAGRAAAAAGDWVGAGTANLVFHAGIVAMHGSPRLDEFFRGLMTEMRLGFLAVDDARALHEPYLKLNGEICAALAEGAIGPARRMLDRYLTAARDQVVAAV
jgi:DNA-binding GntR family transcriptional regulator